MQGYKGSVKMIAGLVCKSGNFPLLATDQIQALPDGTRLDKYLQDKISSAGSGVVSASTKNEITANTAVGGVAPGTTFIQSTDLEEIIRKMLQKEITPTVSVSTNATTLNEVGTTIPAGKTFTLNITNASTQTTEIEKVLFYKGSTLLESQDYVSGKNSYTYTETNPITTNTTITGRLVYNTDKFVSASATVSFVYASYIGITTTPAPDADEIKTFTKKIKSSKGYNWENITCSNSLLCYAFPATMGSINSIKDANNFEYINSYNKTAVTIDGQAYNVYTLGGAVTLDNFKQTFA